MRPGKRAARRRRERPEPEPTAPAAPPRGARVATGNPADPEPPIAPALAGGGAAGGSERGRENTYTLIYGAKGMGKTTLARGMYLRHLAAGGSGVVVDPGGTNQDLGTVVTSPGRWYRYARGELARRRPFSAVVQFGWGQDRDPLWELVYRTAQQIGGLLLLLDEAEGYANAHRIDPGLSELVSQGRNAEIDIITTVRTPPQLHGELEGNYDRAVTFRQAKRHYARVLNREFFHLDGGAELILQLPRFHYIQAGRGEVRRGVVELV